MPKTADSSAIQWPEPSAGMFRKDFSKKTKPNSETSAARRNGARWVALEVRSAFVGIMGFSIHPKLTEPFRLVVRSRAVFSEDGTSLVTDGKRALRLRKWLCKSCWNDDFRDRLLGLIAVLSNDQTTFQLPLGGDAVAIVDALPLVFISPLTYVQHDPTDRGRISDDVDDGPYDEVSRSGYSDATDADEDVIGDDDDDDDNDNSGGDGPGAP